MVFIQLNLLLALIISIPTIFSYQAKRPTNSLYWMILTLLFSNIYLSIEIEDNSLIISPHVLSNIITVLSITVSASILWVCIYKTTNEPTPKIFSSMIIYEIFLVVLGSCYFVIMNVVPTIITSQIEVSILTLGTMVLILGFALVITENNLFKTGVGLLAIQNGAHIVINSLGIVALEISILLNGLQIFIAIIFVSVVNGQYKASGSVLVKDYAILRH
ncbi:MAG: hypothetical protein ACFE8U_18125 [Candidatus Hermodarchaeota archaeon]